jgi:hypothetical protein
MSRWNVFGHNLIWLVFWNKFYDFPYIEKVIIPTDELIFFRGVAQPPTSDTKRDVLGDCEGGPRWG